MKATNKFYLKLCEAEELSEITEKAVAETIAMEDEDFAPIKLTKEQEENMQGVKKEVIGLAGQIDTEAYNEKFEKSTKRKKNKEEQKEQEKSEQKEIEEEIEKSKDDKKLQVEIEKQKLDQERQGFNESIDYVKDLLGLNEGNTTREK